MHGRRGPSRLWRAQTLCWVVLYRQCCAHDPLVLLAETPAEIREAAERYGRERGVSSLWFRAMQA